MSSAFFVSASRSVFLRRLLFPAACLLAPLAAAQTESEFRSSEMRMRPTWIFFPPVPPPLDLPVLRSSQNSVNPRALTPPELSEYVSEIFYPQVGSQFHARSLNDKQQQQLSDYRATKAALQKELREQLAAAPVEDAAARRLALQNFARRQTPKLVQLEADAEKLRLTLVPLEREWGSFRQWHLGQKERRSFSPIEIAQVMRGYAFYQKNLPLPHRLLLREISLEMLLAGQTAADAAAAQRYTFFSPFLARVLLPDNIPADVAPKLAAYLTKKSALKKELYEAVFQSEGRSFGIFGNPLKSVADKQAPRLAELEALAEEVRVGLAYLAQGGGSAERSPVPPTIAQRLMEISQQRSKLERDATAKLGPLTARVREQRLPVNISYEFASDGLHYTLVPRARIVPDEMKQRIEEFNTQLAAIAEDYGRGLAELVNTREELRQEAAGYLTDKTPAAVEAAMTKAMRLVALESNASAYADYRLAVYEPGLSPEQRRLLFQTSLEALELPLPRGEMQPTVFRETW